MLKLPRLTSSNIPIKVFVDQAREHIVNDDDVVNKHPLQVLEEMVTLGEACGISAVRLRSYLKRDLIDFVIEHMDTGSSSKGHLVSPFRAPGYLLEKLSKVISAMAMGEGDIHARAATALREIDGPRFGDGDADEPYASQIQGAISVLRDPNASVHDLQIAVDELLVVRSAVSKCFQRLSVVSEWRARTRSS